MPQRILLGPQRPVINLGEAIAAGGIPDGELAVISAGWQEAEGDIDDVREAAGRAAVDLGLYGRTEALFAADRRLRDAYRARQDRLIELQRLYRLRLKQLMIAARQVLRSEGDAALIAAESRHAISQLRALDRHHLRRVSMINAEFDASFSPAVYAPLREQVAQLEAMLGKRSTVLITGGNVVVLMNRLRLFGSDRLLADRHVVAWSAGAMALAERIVLYHDRTPLGRRDAELFGPGMGLLGDMIFLPDTTRRLRQKDRIRVGLFARRFSPDVCVALDNGAALQFDGGELRASGGARRLTRAGRLARLRNR